MQKESVERILKALNAASVRYLVAGGLAVVAHGYMRFTADVDLIVDLQEGNVRRAIEALAALGYRPRAPVSLEQFADASVRRRWVAEKGLTVFSLHSTEHPMTEVDLFVEPPLDFETAYQTRLQVNVASGVQASFLGYNDLVTLKRRAGRAQDMVDLEQLRIIKEQTEP